MKEPKELKVGQKHHLLLCYLMLTMTYSLFQSVTTCQMLIIWVEISHGRCLSQADFLDAVEGVKGFAYMIQSFIKIGQKMCSYVHNKIGGKKKI